MEPDWASMPELIKRAGDRGWLAVSCPRAPIRIGVTAATSAEAKELFEASYTRWLAILVSGAERTYEPS